MVFLLFVGALVLAVGLVVLCFCTCRNWVVVMITLIIMSGCHGLQYSSVLVMPLEMSRRRAPMICALSVAVATLVKYGAFSVVHYLAYSVSKFLRYIVTLFAHNIIFCLYSVKSVI